MLLQLGAAEGLPSHTCPERMMAAMSAQPRSRKSPTRSRLKAIAIDFALQGGGAHGAFAWGVLDRALQESRLQVDGVSGTSAGAMNAAVLADGYAEGGPEGARAALERFWRRVSDAARLSPLRRGPLDVLLGNWTLDNSPMFIAMDLASRVFSPYDLGVAAFNPCATSWLKASTSVVCGNRRSRSSSQRPMSRPDGGAYSEMPS